MKFIENTKINFMALKNAGFTVSGIMATGSIILLLMGINLGIDFKGGTMIGLNFSEEVNIEEIRNVMKAIPSDGQVVDLSTEEIKHFGSTDDVMIKVIVNHIYQTMGDKAPEDKNNFILSLDTVSPKVGTELSGKAFWSILSSLALILLYISIRFEFKFAIGAILALIHDITITLGIFSLTGYEITLSTVAAFLTIVGYSLNDTIVILDRIRENMRSSGTVLLDATINKSINQSLSRTLITSLTTLLVITVLLMYGGVTIRPFAFTLLVGVIIGTYSSIYIASTFLSTLYKSN